MATNLQTKQTTTLQAFSYQGVIPPPEMMERFKKLDPSLPERIVKMAEKSMDRADKELDILAQNMSRKQHEAETVRIAIEKGSKYDFRAQIIILVMVIIILGVSILLGLLGLSNIAYLVVAGGFATIMTAAIKGVSNKTK